MWYTGFGGIICCLVANVAGLIFGTNNLEDVNPDLISPVLHKYLPRRSSRDAEKEVEPLQKLIGVKTELPIVPRKSLDVVE